CSEGSPVKIAGEICSCISGEEPRLVAVGTEGKAGAARIEVVLRENQVALWGNRRSVPDSIFFRRVKIIAQEPASNVHDVCGRIEQLDAVGGWGHVAAREDFVDDDRRECWRRKVGRSGR